MNSPVNQTNCFFMVSFPILLRSLRVNILKQLSHDLYWENKTYKLKRSIPGDSPTFDSRNNRDKDWKNANSQCGWHRTLLNSLCAVIVKLHNVCACAVYTMSFFEYLARSNGHLNSRRSHLLIMLITSTFFVGLITDCVLKKKKNLCLHGSI